MTKTYVLDTDVVSIMVNAAPLREWKPVGVLPVAITEIVFVEASAGKPSKAAARMQFLGVIAPDAPEIFEAGSEAARSFAEVLVAWPTPGSTDLGERSVIALSRLSDEYVPVLADLQALHIATEELSGRALSMHAFLHELTKIDKMTPALAKLVSDEFIKDPKSRRKPTWWPHG